MPSTPAYAVTNLAATWSSSPAADAGFPVANLKDGRQAKVCKMGSSSAAWTITADLTTAKQVSCIALCNHDLPAGTTLEVRKSSDNFAGNNVQVMAPTAATAPRTAALTFTATTERYWRVIITQTSSRVATLGEVWICDPVLLSRQFVWGFRHRVRVSHRLIQSESQSLWAIRLGKTSRAYELSWDAITEAQLAELDVLLNDASGRLFLFVLMSLRSNPTTAADQEALLGTLESVDFSAERNFTDLASGAALTILEDAIGVG
jgi:hypothetical protein